MGTAGELVLVIECEVPAHGFHVKSIDGLPIRAPGYSWLWSLNARCSPRDRHSMPRSVRCSRAVRVGAFVYVSGTTASGPHGPVGGNDPGQQAAEVLQSKGLL